MLSKERGELFIIIVLLIVLSFYVTAEDSSRDFTVVNSNEVLRGKINPQGLFETSLFTGASTYTYPIRAPIGRNGIEPTVFLVYNSHDTPTYQGIFGSGWDWSSSYIEPSSDPENSSKEAYLLVINGVGHKLVYDSGSRFRTEIETFFYIENKTGANNRVGKYWAVKIKDGTIYRFGYNNDSELLAENNNSIRRWSLDLINDTHNNQIYYTYKENPTINDLGTVYPLKIEYNNGKERIINFKLESTDRSDSWIMYKSGSRVRYARRISEINITANNQCWHSGK